MIRVDVHMVEGASSPSVNVPYWTSRLVLSRGGIDPSDPQSPEVSLLLFPTPIRMLKRFFYTAAGDFNTVLCPAPETLRKLEYLLLPDRHGRMLCSEGLNEPRVEARLAPPGGVHTDPIHRCPYRYNEHEWQCNANCHYRYLPIAKAGSYVSKQVQHMHTGPWALICMTVVQCSRCRMELGRGIPYGRPTPLTFIWMTVFGS